MLEELLKLVKYKSWANEITFSSLSKVADTELHKQRETNFKNIPSTLNHVYIVDDIFKAHLLGETHNYQYRNTEGYPDFPKLWEQQKTIDQWYVDFILNITDKDIYKVINFTYVGGGKGEMSVSEIIFHIVNHGTYHRGFVSDMMYQIPVTPPANDLTVYLRDVHKRNASTSL